MSARGCEPQDLESQRKPKSVSFASFSFKISLILSHFLEVRGDENNEVSE